MVFTGPTTVVAPTGTGVPGAPGQNPRAVPDLSGKSESAAEKILADLELVVEKRYVIGGPAGTVYSQTPMPPATRPVGGKIVLEILRAPTVAPTPADIEDLEKAINEVKDAVKDVRDSVSTTKTAIASLGGDIKKLRDDDIRRLRDAVDKLSKAPARGTSQAPASRQSGG